MAGELATGGELASHGGVGVGDLGRLLPQLSLAATLHVPLALRC